MNSRTATVIQMVETLGCTIEFIARCDELECWNAELLLADEETCITVQLETEAEAEFLADWWEDYE